MSAPSTPPLVEALADTVASCLDAQSLSAIANLKMDERSQDWLDELADKANEGQLSEQERTEYQSFIRITEFLGMAQLRARARLGLPLAS